MLNTDAVARVADRHMLERLISLNAAAIHQWDFLAQEARDPRVKALLEAAASMERRIASRLQALLPGLVETGR